MNILWSTYNDLGPAYSRTGVGSTYIQYMSGHRWNSPLHVTGAPPCLTLTLGVRRIMTRHFMAKHATSDHDRRLQAIRAWPKHIRILLISPYILLPKRVPKKQDLDDHPMANANANANAWKRRAQRALSHPHSKEPLRSSPSAEANCLASFLRACG